ncbi:MAG: hypothetical protein ACK55I_28695, partial [bacterium]
LVHRRQVRRDRLDAGQERQDLHLEQQPDPRIEAVGDLRAVRHPLDPQLDPRLPAPQIPLEPRAADLLHLVAAEAECDAREHLGHQPGRLLPELGELLHALGTQRR